MPDLRLENEEIGALIEHMRLESSRISGDLAKHSDSALPPVSLEYQTEIGDRVDSRWGVGGGGHALPALSGWSEAARGGDFRFSPPPFIITDTENPAPQPLRDADGLPGLVIGQTTEGTGTAQFCPGDAPGFCSRDVAAFNPTGALNWPPPPLQGVNGLPDHPTELRFPPFLRNPAQGNPRAGDIIPPTGAWKAFWWINPNNGTLFNNADDPSEGYWAYQTYAHGRPIKPGESLNAMIEAPRASAQVFYQFDDLFHDNAIFSPHPTFGKDAIDINDDVIVD